MEIHPIARIRTDFPTKFGIPRQSGLVSELRAVIVMEPGYRNEEAFRGLEAFSHLWLLWEFSESVRREWSPTVRPPRLGGNTRMGVFATRSPFRPNPIGLSSVVLEKIDFEAPEAPLLYVRGADLMDGTPIYDIKPYLPFTDSHPEASAGFADARLDYGLKVDFPESLQKMLPEEERQALIHLLAQDPRPSYQNDPDRVYGFVYAGREVKFKVAEGRLTVLSV